MQIGRDCRIIDVPLDGDIHIRDVMEYEIHKRLIFFFTDPLDERLGLELLPKLVGCESVLCERVIEVVDD